jgi:hypothetical protein
MLRVINKPIMLSVIMMNVVMLSVMVPEAIFLVVCDPFMNEL